MYKIKFEKIEKKARKEKRRGNSGIKNDLMIAGCFALVLLIAEIEAGSPNIAKAIQFIQGLF